MALTSHILIVDDDPDIRQVLNILLREKYSVTEASGGREAVEYVKAHPELDLVLLWECQWGKEKSVLRPVFSLLHHVLPRRPLSPVCALGTSPKRGSALRGEAYFKYFKISSHTLRKPWLISAFEYLSTTMPFEERNSSLALS